MRQSAAHHVQALLISDRHFLYTCFAPMGEVAPGKVLAKIGISTVPMKRLVAIHCGCPFPLEFAAFTPVGGMREAKRAESRALAFFRDIKTRGEWVVLESSEEDKKRFSEKVNAAVQEVTRRPVTWARISKAELSVEVANSIKSGY